MIKLLSNWNLSSPYTPTCSMTLYIHMCMYVHSVVLQTKFAVHKLHIDPCVIALDYIRKWLNEPWSLYTCVHVHTHACKQTVYLHVPILHMIMVVLCVYYLDMFRNLGKHDQWRESLQLASPLLWEVGSIITQIICTQRNVRMVQYASKKRIKKIHLSNPHKTNDAHTCTQEQHVHCNLTHLGIVWIYMYVFYFSKVCIHLCLSNTCIYREQVWPTQSGKWSQSVCNTITGEKWRNVRLNKHFGNK